MNISPNVDQESSTESELGGQEVEELESAIFRGEEKEIRRILNDNPQLINARYCLGHTPLMFAAKVGCLSIIQLLLNYGADIVVSDTLECTLLYYAAHNRNKEVVVFFLEKLPHLINVGNRRKETPLMRVAQVGNLSVVERLLESGANATLSNEFGNTIFHYAAQQSDSNIISLLLKNFSHLFNAQNKCKETPLMYTVYGLNLDVIYFFLQSGAQLELQNDEGDTALHIAIQSVRIEAAKMLLAFGASRTIKNNHGQTPLELLEGPVNEGPFKHQIMTFDNALTKEKKKLKVHSRDLYERGSKRETGALNFIAAWLYLADKPAAQKLIRGSLNLFKKAKNNDELEHEKEMHPYDLALLKLNNSRVLFEEEPVLIFPNEIYDIITAHVLEPYGIFEEASNSLRDFFQKKDSHVTPNENEPLQSSTTLTLR